MSIFDPAFHSQPKKKTKPKPASETFPAAVKPREEKPKSEEDIKEIFSRMQKMHEDLNKKIDSAYELSGKDPGEVEEYFNDPSHFKPQEWDRIQERKEKLEESISGLSKSDLKRKKVKKRVSKMSKDRKGKTLGARKNWLSMR